MGASEFLALRTRGEATMSGKHTRPSVRSRKLTVLTALVAVFALAVPAVAAPDNKNTAEVEVSCDQPLGELTVTIIDRSSSVTAFTEDGQVLVIKHGLFEGLITIEVEGGPTIGPFPESFELASAKGGGFANQLVDCTGVYTFEDTFDLTRRDLAFFGLGDEFLGATTTVSGTFDFELGVIVPGS